MENSNQNKDIPVIFYPNFINQEIHWFPKNHKTYNGKEVKLKGVEKQFQYHEESILVIDLDYS
jgi:hypothetical protein